MAEQERKTKAERREEKRQRRLAEEAEAAAAAKKARVRNGLYAVSLVALLGVVTYFAVGNLSTNLDGAVLVAQEDADEAFTAAGCEELEVTELASREHLQPASAPPASALYTNGRPTASGPHYESPGPVFSGVREEGLDERSTTHNLEHGSIIVWFDPEQVDDATVGDIDEWVDTFNNAGFENGLSGAGLLASPFADPGIDSGKAIALRAWGEAVDCEEFDETVVNAFTIQHYGTRGGAPEAPLGPYPEGVLEFGDGEGADAPGEAPSGDATAPTTDMTVEPTDDASASEDAADEPTDDATDEG